MEKLLMNLSCIVLKTSFCFFLIVYFFLPQQKSFGETPSFDSLSFYKHLKDKNLFMEQIVFAQKLTKTGSADQAKKDSLFLDVAAVYYKMKIPDSCIVTLRKVLSISAFSEKKKELYFSLLLLFRERNMAEKNITNIESRTFMTDVRTSFSILNREKLNMDSVERNISPQIMELRNRYINTPHPYPFLSGAFSAVLPGSGKWYLGYKRQALTAFISNALFAAQAAESYAKAGVSSPQFIITASLFAVFYSGNIFGSILAAKKKKRDYLKEIDHEILGRYHTQFSKLSR
jgi:hypothetical protein